VGVFISPIRREKKDEKTRVFMYYYTFDAGDDQGMALPWVKWVEGEEYVYLKRGKRFLARVPAGELERSTRRGRGFPRPSLRGSGTVRGRHKSERG